MAGEPEMQCLKCGNTFSGMGDVSCPNCNAMLQADANYTALSPVDRAIHDAAQRRSWVIGQSGHDPGPDTLAAEVATLRAEVERQAREIEGLREALKRVAALEPERVTVGIRAVDQMPEFLSRVRWVAARALASKP